MAENLIHPSAKIGKNVEIGPWTIVKANAVIGDNTKIGERCTIGEGVVIGKDNYLVSDIIITGKTIIGNGNIFWPGCKVGFGPKDQKLVHYHDGKVSIGNNNFFGENVMVNAGEQREDDNTTYVYDRCYMMNNVEIHHNDKIGYGDFPNHPTEPYDTIMRSSVICNGDVVVYKGAVLGCDTTVHQYRQIGNGAFTGMGALVVADVPPFSIYYDFRIHRVNAYSVNSYFGVNDEKEVAKYEDLLKTICLERDNNARIKLIKNSDLNKNLKQTLEKFDIQPKLAKWAE